MENATVGRLPDSATDNSGSQGSKNAANDKDKKRKKNKKNKNQSDKNVDNKSEKNKSDKSDSGNATRQNGDFESKGEDSTGAKVAKTGLAVGATTAAIKGFGFVQLITWLKGALQAGIAVVKNLASMLVGWIGSAVQAVGTVVMTGITAIAGATGASTSVVAIVLAGSVLLTGGGLISVLSASSAAEDIVRSDGLLENCSDNVEFVQENAASDVDVTGRKLENAQKIYSFYHEFGAPDEHIAGILGNWEVESNLDPTCVEGDYYFLTGENYIIGPKKQAAFADLDAYTLKVIDLHNGYEPGYRASDGKHYCGMGLGQWTGSNAGPLWNTAEAMSMDWYSLEFQLIYTIMDGGYRVEWLIPWFGEIEDNAETAAFSFAKFWEGNTSRGAETRKSNAAGWMVRFADWEIDADYANSLIELAGTARVDASQDGTKDALDDCQTQRIKYDNSSIARAAVSYAWPRSDQGTHNNGTLLYQCVHDYIFGRGGYYASCCRGGSVAVRWSGSDDSFPAGGCAPQFAHCTSSTKWERVCDLNGMSYSDICETLAPGDILICNSCHTLVWTGNELIKEIHGEDSPDNYVAVEASYGNKSPVCIPLWSSYYNGAYYEKHGGPHHFIAWRCVDPDNSDTYKNAADGAENYTGSAFNPNRYP